MRIPALVAELRRRNVFRVAAAYIIAAWALVQVGDVLFPTFGISPTILRVLTIVLALLFPVVLALAWTFEWTREGIARDTGEDEQWAGRVRVRRKTDIAILLLAVVVVAGVIVMRDWSGDMASPKIAPRVADADRQSIAVLPFRNTTADSNDLPLADGISETLINQLGQVRGLRVTARGSSFSFRDVDVDPRTIGERLGVSSILDGSIQRSGDRLRIIAELIDARSGTQLWTAQFDRRVSDIFAIQDEIGRSVINALQVTLLGTPGKGKRAGANQPPIDAYQAYLVGRREYARHLPTGMDLAIQNFQRAIELAPDYAEAYVGLADAYLGLEGMNPDEPGALLPDAEAAIEKALQLNPELGEAHAALGEVFYFREDLVRATSELERAIQLNPSHAHAFQRYSDVLRQRFDNGEEGADFLARSDAALQTAYELDPLSVVINHSLGGRESEKGNIELAIHHYRIADASEPDSTIYSVWIGNLYARNFARLDEAARWYRRAESSYMGNYATSRLVGAYIDMLDVDSAEKTLNSAVQDRTGVPWFLQMASLWIAEANFDDEKITTISRQLVVDAPVDIVGYLPHFEAERALTFVSVRNGRCDEAAALYADRRRDLVEGDIASTVEDMNDSRVLGLAYTEIECGDAELARAVLEALHAYYDKTEQDAMPLENQWGFDLNRAITLSLLRREGPALDMLERALAKGPALGWSALTEKRRDPRFDAIRESPRFVALIDRMTKQARDMRLDFAARAEVSSDPAL